MIIDLEGDEINEWQEWQASKTISLEFTRAELEAVSAALEWAHQGLVAETANLQGKALQNACAASAAILGLLLRAGRHLD